MEERRHRAERWAIGALVVLLAVLGVLIFKPARNTPTAQAKATQLESLFAAHHLPVPVDRHSLIAVLGSHGGSVCASPAGALNVALKDQQFYNGAAGEGARPIRASARIVEGEELVLQVYCPSKLAAFERYANGNGYYAVVRR